MVILNMFFQIISGIDKMKKKLLIIDEKNFKDLKRIWRGGIFARCSDSLFIRELIDYNLKKELKK